MTPDIDAALALNKVAHDLVPGVRHDFGLEALPRLAALGYRIVPADAPLAGCQCPAVWNSVLPPSCPIHNPAAPGVVTTTTNTTGGFVPPTTSVPAEPKEDADAPLDVRCAKCGSTDIYTQYESHTDRLERRCRECRYNWWDKPLDARDDAKDGKSEPKGVWVTEESLAAALLRMGGADPYEAADLLAALSEPKEDR